MTANQQPVQAVLVSQPVPSSNQQVMQIALFDSNGNPANGITFDDMPLGSDIVLTGFVAGSDTAVAATDNVNQAIGKVQAKAIAAKVASNVLLTGYTIGVVALAAVSASDSVMAAIAKLEKRIADLEAA